MQLCATVNFLYSKYAFSETKALTMVHGKGPYNLSLSIQKILNPLVLNLKEISTTIGRIYRAHILYL